MLDQLDVTDYAILFVAAAVIWYAFFLPKMEKPIVIGPDDSKPPRTALESNKADVPFMTREEVRVGDGKNGNPIYISIANKVFDCSAGAQFYGPGGSYESFAGRDITRAAAKFSTEERYLDCPSIQDLSPAEMDSMKHFYNVIAGKYKLIGKLRKEEYVGNLPVSKEAGDRATVQHPGAPAKVCVPGGKTCDTGSTAEEKKEEVVTASAEKDDE